MNITSHFIGIKVNSRPFVDLFIKIQQYIKEQKIEQVLELQDIHSLHVSLYYLDKEILPPELKNIKELLTTLTKTYNNFLLTTNELAYFKKDGVNFLSYLACPQIKMLTQLNNQLVKKFQNQVPDNQYGYIPHITLFKIINYELFIKHQENIENIVQKQLINFKNESLFQGFFLFEVNSEYHPEIQFIVNFN